MTDDKGHDGDHAEVFNKAFGNAVAAHDAEVIALSGESLRMLRMMAIARPSTAVNSGALRLMVLMV